MKSEQTSQEIRESIMEAAKILEEARVPEDLRVTAFQKAFDALMGSGTEAAPLRTRENPALAHTEPETNGPSLNAVAAKLGLDVDLVHEIYYIDGDSIGLAAAASKFDSKKAAATQQIALLLAAGRQAGGWDEWTPTSRIRDVCRDYGRFDAANFATTIKKMADVFSFRGRARAVEVRLTRPGYEQAASLARELSGA